MNKIAPFVGAILIVAGLIMLFKGSTIIYYVFGFLMGCIGTAIFFMFFYTPLLFENDTSTGKMVGVLILSLVLGGLTFFLTQKFAKAWTVTIIAAFGGFCLGMVCVGMLNIKNSFAQILLLVLGAALGLVLGKKFDGYVNAVGTSLIGAFMVVRGVGCYAPGYPSSFNKGDIDSKSSYYMMAWFLLFIGGSVFQVVNYKEEKAAKTDDFTDAEDEGKCCSRIRI